MEAAVHMRGRKHFSRSYPLEKHKQTSERRTQEYTDVADREVHTGTRRQGKVPPQARSFRLELQPVLRVSRPQGDRAGAGEEDR